VREGHCNEANGSINAAGLEKPGIGQAALLFSVVVVLFLVIGSRLQHREFYSGVLITEYVLILVPVLVFLIVFKFDIRGVMRLNAPGLAPSFLTVFIMAAALPAVGVFNLLNLWLVKTIFGNAEVVQPPAAKGAAELVLSLIVIGLTPAICEEAMFRGVLQRSFERLGAVRAILVTSLLFGLIHVDFQKLLGTFLLGALIGFIVYRTNSLFAGMLAHFTNNSIAVLLTFILGICYDWEYDSPHRAYEPISEGHPG
jgi:hypothetical protein